MLLMSIKRKQYKNNPAMNFSHPGLIIKRLFLRTWLKRIKCVVLVNLQSKTQSTMLTSCFFVYADWGLGYY